MGDKKKNASNESGGSLSREEWADIKEKLEASKTGGSCPNCGYCPHCGHAPPRQFTPYIPYVPYIQPVIPWWQRPTWSSGTYTIPLGVTSTTTTAPTGTTNTIFLSGNGSA